jgi:hypothetical protein
MGRLPKGGGTGGLARLAGPCSWSVWLGLLAVPMTIDVSGWTVRVATGSTPPMLVLKITNASEVVSAKLGKFLASLTPETLDRDTVEDVLIKKLIENLAAEGLRGEVAAVRGFDLVNNDLVIHDHLHVRRHQTF